MKTGLDVIEYRKVSEETDILERSGDTGLVDIHDSLSGSILAVKDDPAARGIVYLGQKIEDGRLSRAVGADQTYDLTVIDLHVEVVDSCQTAEVDAELLYVENGCFHVVICIVSHWKHLLSPCGL